MVVKASGSHFSVANCSKVSVAIGRFWLWFLVRRQFAKRLRASLLEILLTGPSTFERRTLLKVLSGCSIVSRQRATHIFLLFPFTVRQPFWNLRRITILPFVIRPLVLASVSSVALLSRRTRSPALTLDPCEHFGFAKALMTLSES